MKMKIFVVLALSLWGTVAYADTYPAVYGDIYKSVDRTRLTMSLTTLASERFTPAGKDNFRKFWGEFYDRLQIPVKEFAYDTAEKNGEAQGHNLEAILPGSSPDSVIIIVHYDSTGPAGTETQNPGVDDDMTGMAVQLETARLLSANRGRLHYTVRFVAADYEEFGHLEGSRKYAEYVKDLAAREGFKIIAAIDDEQSGWNCAREGKCQDGSTQPKFVINDCSNNGKYGSPEFSKQFVSVAHAFSSLPIVTECSGADSDHYSFWEIGATALEFGEYSWQTNDHFDNGGGDTLDKIDFDYFFSIAQVGITFAATTVGIQ